MWYGCLYTLVTGLLWTCVGLTLTAARRAKCQVEHFYIVGSLGAVLMVLGYQLYCGELFPSEWSGLVVACMIANATFNALSNLCSMLNLSAGTAALYFALNRMGFSISFLWSVIVWREHWSWLNAFGIACLVSAVVCSAYSKKSNDKAATQVSRKRLLLSMGSTFSAGFSQICLVYPFSASFRSLELPQLPPLTKTVIIMLVNIVFFTIITLCRKYKEKPSYKALLGTALTWSVLAIGSYAALFASLKYMGQINRSGIVFPIGGAIQIFMFAVCTRIIYHEKLDPLQKVALGLIILGIFAVEIHF